MDEQSLEIIKSADGSTTIYRKDLDETYHSTNGAIVEANHVFIRSGLSLKLEELKEVSILEIGLGTGLNVLQTFEFVKELDVKIKYHGLEAFPFPLNLVHELNYCNNLDDESKELFKNIHFSKWGEKTKLNSNFELIKIHEKLEEVILTNKYEIIYFDAFGPKAQGDMWMPKHFTKLYKALNEKGIFVTYCAKGQVRRDLQSVGFKMERIPGPPGKREMLRGVK